MPTNISAIAGIGTDIIYMSRIQNTFERFGQKFVKRILGNQEQEVFKSRYSRDRKRGIRYIATRFAAKEAFSKAIGLGIRSPMAWTRVQILNASSGKPSLTFSEPLKSWYEERFGLGHVSLTDEADIVMAFVILERKV
ncbi:holo-ACP synthase [Taylorella asinigenitalis]|uniref:holo-ACP synthase n=1 Tax=Taylorella asinigenitalis TaxID=84590 RepID=UPI0004066227|nr:holo-ACP synthase [Taylorella asinigenitalis]